jgi:ABC-2 type transport system ATP-binding protein
MSAFEIRGLCKSYKGKKGKRVEALKDLNLEIFQGEVFGFLGPNGAGKSTTIKTILGQLKPDCGIVNIFGVPVNRYTSRLKVGYLPENPAFYDFLTAREFLRFIGKTFAMDEESIVHESEKVLKLLELSESADRPIRSYSKGMVQRLGIAQALLHDPDLYILDEPMSGLDPLGRAMVKDIIKNLKTQGKTVFFSTHITADVEVVCDRVGVIAGGILKAVDSVKNILQTGIEGYEVQVNLKNGAIEELFVEKENFKLFMENIIGSDSTIDRIEPRRKDVESFFLDIVVKGNNVVKE